MASLSSTFVSSVHPAWNIIFCIFGDWKWSLWALLSPILRIMSKLCGRLVVLAGTGSRERDFHNQVGVVDICVELLQCAVGMLEHKIHLHGHLVSCCSWFFLSPLCLWCAALILNLFPHNSSWLGMVSTCSCRKRHLCAFIGGTVLELLYWECSCLCLLLVTFCRNAALEERLCLMFYGYEYGRKFQLDGSAAVFAFFCLTGKCSICICVMLYLWCMFGK